MTQYSTNADFSTDAAGATEDSTHTTAITGYTWSWNTTGSGPNWNAVITTGGTIGANYVRIARNGSGDSASLIVPTAVGSLASGVETEILMHFRLGGLSENVYVGRMRSDIVIANDSPNYSLYVLTNGNTRIERWHGAGSATSNDVTAGVASGLTTNTWYWARVHVSDSPSTGTWKYKVWSGALSAEPGSYAESGVDTTRQVGYVGIGSNLSGNSPLDFDWFSIGTAGSAAPGPLPPAITAPATGVSAAATGGIALGFPQPFPPYTRSTVTG